MNILPFSVKTVRVTFVLTLLLSSSQVFTCARAAPLEILFRSLWILTNLAKDLLKDLQRSCCILEDHVKIFVISLGVFSILTNDLQGSLWLH